MSQFVKIVLLPLVIISIVSIGAVEGFYYWLEQQLGGSSVTVAGGFLETGAAGGSHKKKINEKPADYSLIVERNLFSSGGAVVGGTDDFDSLEGMNLSSLDLVLMGTALGGDDKERAIIYDKNAKKQDLYQVGDYVQQAVIKKILRGKVVINYNGTDEILDISEARNVPVPQVAKVKPVVQAKKVSGRPVGQSSTATPVKGPMQKSTESQAGAM